MRALWMALLAVAWVTGCGSSVEQQEQAQPSRPAEQWQRMTEMRARNMALQGVLAASSNHSLALNADGTVWAWGNNDYGALGDGTTRSHSLPVEVVGLERVKSIVTGSIHTLALREDGTVWAWGSNYSGQLGQPASYSPTPTPTQVPELTDVVGLAAGDDHSLALRGDGTVWTWGANYYGQLGRPVDYMPAPVPEQVQGLTDVVAVAAHSNHSLALREDGTVWAWGSNWYGQLGDGTTLEHDLPAQVQGLTGVVALATSDSHVLALRGDGTVWAWGANYQGQLGQPFELEVSLTPVQVPELTNVTGVAAGSNFSLALREDGTVWAWGDNSHGQLGDGTTTSRSTPRPVEGLKHVIALAADRHPLAMSKNGIVWAWGRNDGGQLGTGTDRRTAPVPVLGLSNTRTVSAGATHSLALRDDGTVWAWGYNWDGQLGDGTFTQRAAPVQVRNLSAVVAVSAGGSHSLALREDGTVWAWGYNWNGQLGQGAPYHQPTPAQVPGLSGVVAIVAMSHHSLALREDGTVWAWGSNYFGQLGRPANYSPNPTPAQVPGLTGVTALASSSQFVLALREDGTVWAWGSNTAGQLGRPANDIPDPTPAQVPGLTGVTALAAGNSHSLALREDGTVWAWGSNYFGELGRPVNYSPNPTPAQVPGLTDAVGITTSGYSSLVTRRDGTVWGVGSNDLKLLANTEEPVYSTPVQRPELAGVRVLSTSERHALAVLADGTVRAWGSNAVDQIGDGVSSTHVTPARVKLPCRFTAMPSRDNRASEAEHCPALP